MQEVKNRQYWLHRITGGENGWVLSHPLLEKHGLLSIGWGFISSQDVAISIQGKGIPAIVDIYNKKKATWRKSAYSLLNFVNRMHKDDIVIVPRGRLVRVYRIVEDNILTNENLPQAYLDEANVHLIGNQLYYGNDDEYVDLGFYRKVEPLTTEILRWDIDDEIQRKTRAQQTNLDITYLADKIDALIKAYPTGTPTSECEPITYEQLIKNLESQLDFINEDGDKNEDTFEGRINKTFEVMYNNMRNGIIFNVAGGGQSEYVLNYSDAIDKDIKKSKDNIKKVISTYMSGDLSSSIKHLDDWWGGIKDKYFPYFTLNQNEIYYRIRKKDKENKVFTEKDLFHVPLTKRGSVTTKRFSIPGYPCLYLGKSIYACWEEMKRPALSEFATSAFKVQEDERLLDLRLKKIMRSEKECETFVRILPMIVACSLKVASENDNFKPEYIVPQLLLHSIVVKNQKSDHKLGGIIYTSTAIGNDFEFIDIKNADTYELADCLVLPIRISNSKTLDYCKELSRVYWVSKPRYYENEHVKDPLAFIRENISSLPIRQSELTELPSQITAKYDTSYFAYMEKILKESSFSNINERSNNIAKTLIE